MCVCCIISCCSYSGCFGLCSCFGEVRELLGRELVLCVFMFVWFMLLLLCVFVNLLFFVLLFLYVVFTCMFSFFVLSL